MFKFIISIRVDRTRWKERDELVKFFPDYRVISHVKAMERGRKFLLEEISHLPQITVEILFETIILTKTDTRFISAMKTAAKLCVDEMNYCGFYFFTDLVTESLFD